MCNVYTTCQVELMNKLRELWVQHVYWTRFFIISTASDLADTSLVTKHLLQNPNDFAKVLCKFYTPQLAARFKELFTDHLLIAADLVNAAKNGESVKVEEARKKWYRNADDIASFLSCINPFWSEKQWKALFYSHLKMTEDEAVLRLGGKYAEDIKMFDMIEKEALKMADVMSCGIIEQFSFK